MMQLSYSYLDDYYLLTSKQANKSFAVMLAVSIGGAILIGIGIVGTFLGNLENIYLVYLSTITGIIIEFISAIFFYFYNNTIISLGKYHNKLMLSQNISIALKIAEDNPAMLKEIVKQLVDNINYFLSNVNENGENNKD